MSCEHIVRPAYINIYIYIYLNAEFVQENNIHACIQLATPAIAFNNWQCVQAGDHPVNKLLGQTINMHKIPERIIIFLSSTNWSPHQHFKAPKLGEVKVSMRYTPLFSSSLHPILIDYKTLNYCETINNSKSYM